MTGRLDRREFIKVGGGVLAAASLPAMRAGAAAPEPYDPVSLTEPNGAVSRAAVPQLSSSAQ